MKLRSFLFAWLLVAFGATGQAQTDTGAAGTWHGVIDVPGEPLTVEVTLDRDNDAWRGTVDIPAQQAFGLDLTDIVIDGDDVSFVIGAVPGDPTFTGTIVNGRIEGSFSQAGHTFPFELQSAKAQEAVAEDPAAAEPEAAAPAPTDPAAPAEAVPEDVFEDAEGLFSVPIPSGWSVSEQERYVRVSDPAQAMHVYVFALDETDPGSAIADAWRQVDPEFDLEPEQAVEPPAGPGVERTLMHDYGMHDNRIYQAVAQVHDGLAYVLLIDAELEAAQRRGAQLNVVFTGFQIAALEEEDLTGVEPLPVDGVLGELEAFITESLGAFGVPGAAVAIVQDGEVVYSEAFGVREAGGDVAMTTDTHMMIGSTGKTMTTTLMAALVDEGAFDWDTPVVEVLPEFAVADPELTEATEMRHLVCACTGVPRRDLELFFNASELTAEGVVESLETFEFFTDFGEAFQYSNQLVATGGFAAAAADGAEYGALYEGYVTSLQARLLEPVGMRNTTLSFEEVEDRGEHATPHQFNWRGGEYTPIDLDIERLLLPVAPAGAHWSTADDMALYLATHLGRGVSLNGTRIASEDNLAKTWEPQVPITATDSYGLGWIVGEYNGLDLLQHGGNTLGFTSEFAFLPEVELGIVVLTNAQGSTPFNAAVRTRLFELVFEQPPRAEEALAFGLAQGEQMLAELHDSVADSASPAAVESHLGTYFNDALGEITLALQNGTFVLDAGEFAAELRPELDDDGEVARYLAFDVPIPQRPLELREEDGELYLLFGAGLEAYEFEKVD